MSTKKEKVLAFKAGSKVSHAKHGAGKVRAVLTRKNGTWLEVDFGDKKNPNIKNVRPGTLIKA